MFALAPLVVPMFLAAVALVLLMFALDPQGRASAWRFICGGARSIWPVSAGRRFFVGELGAISPDAREIPIMRKGPVSAEILIDTGRVGVVFWINDGLDPSIVSTLIADVEGLVARIPSGVVAEVISEVGKLEKKIGVGG